MALIIAQHFRKYNALADVANQNDDNTLAGPTVWVQDTNQFSTSGGRFGHRVYENVRDFRVLMMRFATAMLSGSTVIIGASVRWQPTDGTSGIVNGNLLAITTTTFNQYHASLAVNAGGILSLQNTNNSTVSSPSQLHATELARANFPGHRLMPNVWHRLEFKVECTNSGTATVRLDGVQIMQVATTDFLHSTTAIRGIILGGVEDTIRWEDVVVMDGSGSQLNDFVGDLRFECVLPDADGATTDWTATAGSDFQVIDDALPLPVANYDTDYIHSSTTDQDTLVSHASVSATNQTAIHFVQVEALSRADAAGDRIALLCRSGGTTYASGDMALINGTYRWRRANWALDPNGSVAWTVANINAAEFGVRKRV